MHMLAGLLVYIKWINEKSHCHNIIINDFIEQVSKQVAGLLWFNTLHAYTTQFLAISRIRSGSEGMYVM